MKGWIVFAILSVLLISLFAYASRAFLKSRRPHIWDIWVINLEKDTERWKSIQSDSAHIAGMVHRWPATNGSQVAQTELIREGVGFAMTRSGDGHKEDARPRNLGTIGCWLSHKHLLTHLASLSVPDHAGHLILEDDVAIPPDFLQLEDAWHRYFWRIPTDWDVVYFGITNPHGESVTPEGDILKLKTLTEGGGNWGTHAYLVRQGAIRDKLLPTLRWMTDAIDEQYNQYFSEWNVYAVNPNIIPLKSEFSEKSSLKGINAGDQKNGAVDIGY
jgi:GR25 family glycosyltransferase involved in LPS biosynthesis